jgi:hypothetical protein
MYMGDWGRLALNYFCGKKLIEKKWCDASLAGWDVFEKMFNIKDFSVLVRNT